MSRADSRAIATIAAQLSRRRRAGASRPRIAPLAPPGGVAAAPSPATGRRAGSPIFESSTLRRRLPGGAWGVPCPLQSSGGPGIFDCVVNLRAEFAGSWRPVKVDGDTQFPKSGRPGGPPRIGGLLRRRFIAPPCADTYRCAPCQGSGAQISPRALARGVRIRRRARPGASHEGIAPWARN